MVSMSRRKYKPKRGRRANAPGHRKEMPHGAAPMMRMPNGKYNENYAKLFALRQAGEFKESAKYVGKIISEISPDAKVYAALGGVLLEANMIHDAESLCKEAVRLGPRLSYTHQTMGLFFRRSGEPDKAIQSYDAALKYYKRAGVPDYELATLYSNKGAAFVDLNFVKESIELFDKAIAADPKYAVAYLNKANALRVLGRYDEADTCISTAVSLNPNVQFNPLKKTGSAFFRRNT